MKWSFEMTSEEKGKAKRKNSVSKSQKTKKPKASHKTHNIVHKKKPAKKHHETQHKTKKPKNQKKISHKKIKENHNEKKHKFFDHDEKPIPHKGKVHGRGRKEVEFVTRVPDGRPRKIRHMVNEYGDVVTLETNIDRLYRLVQKEGEVKVREAGKHFGVGADLVEEWGRVLESHDLIIMHYPAFGELLIRSKEWLEDKKRKKEEEKEKKIKEKEKKKHKKNRS